MGWPCGELERRGHGLIETGEELVEVGAGELALEGLGGLFVVEQTDAGAPQQFAEDEPAVLLTAGERLRRSEVKRRRSHRGSERGD